MANRNTKATPRDAITPMCCLTIEHVELLVPADTGLKLAQLLQGAVRCEQTWNRGESGTAYLVRDPVQVQYASVKASEIRMPEPEKPKQPKAPLMLGHEPGKLTYTPRES